MGLSQNCNPCRKKHLQEGLLQTAAESETANITPKTTRQKEKGKFSLKFADNFLKFLLHCLNVTLLFTLQTDWTTNFFFESFLQE